MSDTNRTRYRFVIEAILFLGYAAFGLSWIGVTPLIADIQPAFGISSAEFGLINTLVAISKTFAPLLTGLLAVKLGIRRTVLLGMLLIAFSILPPLATTFPVFLAGRLIFGLGGAVVVTLLGAVVMQWFPRDELPVVNAFNNIAVNSGITVALFVTVPIAARLGWRHTLLLYGCLNLLLAVSWALLGRDHDGSRTGSTAGAPRARSVRYTDVWRMKETWLVTLCFAGPLALYLVYNTWLPKYYVTALGMSRAAASQFTGLFNLVGIPAAIGSGILTSRLGLRRPFLIVAGIFIGFAAFGMFLTSDPTLITVSAICLGICLFAGASPLVTTAMELPGMTPQHISLMMGTVFSLAYSVSALAPTLTGWLFDTTGSFTLGFSVWAAFSWVLLIGGAMLPETGPRRSRM